MAWILNCGLGYWILQTQVNKFSPSTLFQKHRVGIQFTADILSCINKNSHSIFSFHEKGWLPIFTRFAAISTHSPWKATNNQNYWLAFFLKNLFWTFSPKLSQYFLSPRSGHRFVIILFGKESIYVYNEQKYTSCKLGYYFHRDSRAYLCFEFDRSDYCDHFLSLFVSNHLMESNAIVIMGTRTWGLQGECSEFEVTQSLIKVNCY